MNDETLKQGVVGSPNPDSTGNSQSESKGTGDVAPTSSHSDKGEEMVPVKKSALVDLLARMEKLESEQASHNSVIAGIKEGEWIENKAQTHTATLKKYRKNTDEPWQLVVGWEMFEQDPEKDKHILKVFFRNPEGEVTERKLDLRELVAMQDAEVVKIIDRKVKKMIMSQGQTTIKSVEYDNHRTIDTGIKVPLQVEKEVITVKVQTQDGQEFEMSEEFLNHVGMPEK